MTPIDHALAPLRNYAGFSGRARRAEYWWYVLLLIVAYVVATIIEDLLGLAESVGPYGPLTLLIALGTLVPSLAVGVRRLHDTNRSGWWLLIGVVPYFILGIMMGVAIAQGNTAGALASAGVFGLIAIIGGIVLLVFMVLAGTPGDNRFGPDPKAGERRAAA